ncbi:MGDG synthase family glycosyltransferase [Paenibacillus protaetiae]|nr:glycosyltransferase [Paenibacillus protaetiae]
MRKKRVLLLSEGFGSGHTQAAYALAASLRQLHPGVTTRVFELGNFLNPRIGPLIVSAYRKTVSKQPKMVGLMYRSNYEKSLNRFTQLALHRMFYTHTSQVIDQLRPDLIICTHPVPNAVVGRLKRLGMENTPLYTVITDYDAHGAWINQEVDKYLVSTPIVQKKLQERGVPASRIEVTGIPVHPEFWSTGNKQEALKHFGLKDMPTVLVMGGGWGLMDEDDEMLEYMSKWRDGIQFIYCVGSNEKARESMLANPAYQHENVRIIGFTREISKLMDIADILITKPGGMTCTEGMTKGIPMLFYHPIPGQEEENCQFFVRHGFGEVLDSKATASKWFARIMNPEEAEQFRRRMLAKRNQYYDPLGCTKAVLQFMQ